MVLLSRTRILPIDPVLARVKAIDNTVANRLSLFTSPSDCKWGLESGVRFRFLSFRVGVRNCEGDPGRWAEGKMVLHSLKLL